MNVNRYDIDLEIKPSESFLRADVTFHYYVKEEPLLKLYLHRHVELESLTCAGMTEFYFETTHHNAMLEEAKVLCIKLHEERLNQEIKIQLRYSGNIKIVSKWEINRITEEFVELGLYTPFFPLTMDFEECLFHVILKIDGYIVMNNYDVLRVENTYYIDQREEQNDCVIIASKSLTEIEPETYPKVYFIDLLDKNKGKIIKEKVSELVEYFSITFGVIENSRLNIVIVPRTEGGSYVRKNLIVMCQTDDGFELNDLRFLAHETSHLWWSHVKNVNSYEDWLNESFAEYSSLITVRERYGLEKFTEIINRYREKTKHLKPIIGLSRSDEEAYLVLYLKGALHLYELECMLGYDKMLTLLRETHQQKINTTERFLSLLEQLSNREIREQFYLLLSN